MHKKLSNKLVGKFCNNPTIEWKLHTKHCSYYNGI